MAGAIAGTAILKIEGLQNVLNTVTLTINNECNMKCSHCYLQYNSDRDIISDDVLKNIFSNKFGHLVIVGKEPLVNDLSIKKLCSIVERCREANISISFVTNGLNLSSLPTYIIPLLNYVDVSFDGGAITYERFRKGNLSRIIDGIHFCMAHGLEEVNALHTICDQTINNITDCISLKEYIPFKSILFTPYIVTCNQGDNGVSMIPLLEIIRQFDLNDTFNDTEEAQMLIDNYHIEQEKLNVVDLDDALSKVKCKNKYHFIKNDPIFYGIVRVTYDGLILSPRQSLHTAFYNNSLLLSQQNNLNMAFQKLLKQETESYGDKRVEL